MKISWICWWTISCIEIISFIGVTIFLWTRKVDAAGIIQTTELKWTNVAIMAIAYLIPLMIQLIWLIINLVLTKNRH
jgi:hypothetical protein